MHRLRRGVFFALALSAATAALTVAPATAAPVSTAKACWAGAPTVFDVNWAAGSSLRGGDREPSSLFDPSIGPPPTITKKAGTIPVYFHVITDGATGNLSNQKIQQQMNVLNSEFGGFEGGVATGFSFKLAGVDRIDNANWFHNLDAVPWVEREAKPATRVGDARTLNIWTTDLPGYFGFATFPTSYKTSAATRRDRHRLRDPPRRRVRRALLARQDGDARGRPLARPAAHVPGRLQRQGRLRRRHAVEALAGERLSDRADTCPAPGFDPIHNYMDYSDDFCYDQFTAGQAVADAASSSRRSAPSEPVMRGARR